MNETKWRIRWRYQLDGNTGTQLDHGVSKEHALKQLADKALAFGDYYDWTIESIPEPKPEPKPPGILWRLHWRSTASGDVSCWNRAHPFDYAAGSLNQVLHAPAGSCAYWIQPDGTEPALKDGKGAIVWRVHFVLAQDGSKHSLVHAAYDSREDAQKLADSRRTLFRVPYWVQPESAEEKIPEPKPNETLWRVHWRNADGGLGRWGEGRSLAHARQVCESYNKDARGSINWIQPEGTDDALKFGTGPIRWRIWCKITTGTIAQYRNTPPGEREDRQRYADELASMFSGATYWIQPELLSPSQEVSQSEPIHWSDSKTGQSGTYHVDRFELMKHGAIWRAARDCEIEFLTDKEKRAQDDKWRVWQIDTATGRRMKTPSVGPVKEMAGLATAWNQGPGLTHYFFSVERDDAT